MKFLSVLALCLFAAFGCSTINLKDPAHALAIQYATGKYIEAGNSTFRAKKILDEIENVKKLIDLQGVSVTDLKSAVLKRVSDEGLSVADTLLATALIDAVELKIDQDISSGVIDPETKVRVNEALSLIKHVASLYL